MIEVSQTERNYILAGNYDLLNAVIVAANREILLLEKKYDEMLERKNAELAGLKTPNPGLNREDRQGGEVNG